LAVYKYRIPLVKDEKGRDVMKYFPKHRDFPMSVRLGITGVNFVLPDGITVKEGFAILESEVPIPELEGKEGVKRVE